jgi:hypothetical protein
MPAARQRKVVISNLLVGEASKDILPAPGLRKRYSICGLHYTHVVSAAQTLDIQDTSGTPINVLKLPVSFAVGRATDWSLPDSSPGIPLGVNLPLRFVVGAAGNAGSLIVEYYEEVVGVEP